MGRRILLFFFFFQQENSSWDVTTHNALYDSSGSVCSINYKNIDETNQNSVQKLKTNTLLMGSKVFVESMKNIPLSRMWKTGSGPEITFLFLKPLGKSKTY